MQEESRELVPAGIVALPATVNDIIREMEAYQQLCDALLTNDDHSIIEGNKRRNKSAWRKLARAFNVSDEILTKVIHRDDGLRVVSADFEVEATAPNGRTSVGIASCSIWERAHEEDDLWPSGDVKCPGPCDGRSHFSNVDHTIPATAHTRAKNRAIADLIGAGEVSAEEIGAERVVESKSARPVDDMPIENPGEMVLGFSRSHRDKKIKDVPRSFLEGFVNSDADWAVGSRQKYPGAYSAAKAFLEESQTPVTVGPSEEKVVATEADARDLPDQQVLFAGEGSVEELQEALPMAEVREVARDTDEELDEPLTLKEFEGMCIHLRKYAAGAGWEEEKIRSLFERHHLDGDSEVTKGMFIAAKDEVQLSVSEGRLEEAAE